MRPLRLELRGFTAFRDRAVIDFRDRTLFAITGPTGAGKSSLLDAMIWALYGQVPRVGRATKQLVTHGERSMSVRFDFASRGATYRVARTTGSAGARLERLVDSDVGDVGDGEWEMLADRAAGVTEQVTELLGLDYRTFTRTIVLPQGEFDSFLRGEEKDRRQILGRLLGLEAYVEAGRAARARAATASQMSEALGRRIEELTLGTPAAVAALREEEQRLRDGAEAAEAMRRRLDSLAALAERDATGHREAATTAAAALSAQTVRTEAAQAHLAAEGERATLEGRRQEQLAGREALAYDSKAHAAVRRLVELLDVRDRAVAAVEAAQDGREHAEAAVTETERVHAESVVQAARRTTERDSAQADLDLAGRALAAAASGASALRERLAAAAEAAECDRAEAERVGVEQDQRTHALAALERQVAAGLSALSVATAARSEADVTRAAAVAAVQSTAGAFAAAERDAEAASADRDAARMQDAAAALQRELSLGDPCPICGEPIEHLAPHNSSALEAAEANCVATERAASQARAASDENGRRAAAAAAVLEEAIAAVERAASQLDGIDGELAAAGARRESVAAAVQTATQSAAQARVRGDERRADAVDLREQQHAVDLLLARLPPELPLATVQAPPVVDCESLAVAFAQYAAAQSREAAAATAAQQADQTLATNAATLAARQREFDRAAERVEEAQSQLAQLAVPEPALPGAADGAATADPRAALERWDGLAASARELDAAIAEAETLLAVARERLEGRRIDSDRATVEAAERDEAAACAATAAAALRASLESDWREVLGLHSEPSPQALGVVRSRHQSATGQTAQQLGATGERLERAERELAQAVALRAEIASCDETARVAGALERELHADRFIAFVQREALGALAADASTRLLQLTGDRYRLVTEDDQFWVVDRLNGDQRRSVRTLSGGETFLASLALALALAERLPEIAGIGGAVTLESLFLDEGFGSLDADALDVAIQAIEALAGGPLASRKGMVGIISHVPEVADRLPDRIEVAKTDRTSLVRG